MKGNDVKNLRKKLNLTQVEFAEFIGVDRRTIINYEQGEPIPKSRQVYFTTLMEEFESKNSLPKTEILNVEKGMPNHNTEIVEIEKKSLLDSKYIKALEELIKLKDENLLLMNKNRDLKDQVFVLETNIDHLQNEIFKLRM